MPQPFFPQVGPAPSRRSVIANALRQRVLGVHLGALKPGDRLPSVRTLAMQRRADPRVVHAAYRQLAEEGLVALRPRSGVFVADADGQAETLLPQTAGWVVNLFTLARSGGMPPTELRRQARLCLNTVRVHAACVECNDDQLHALCLEVERDYGISAARVECDDFLRPGPPPRSVEKADLIVTTRFHAGELQRRARRLHRPLIVISLDAAFLAGIRRVVMREPLYFLCTDPRFAAKLPRIFAGMGNAIRPLVIGREPLDVIPHGALVYVMPSAREFLPPGWRHPRVVTAPGVFSTESARTLLTAIVRLNLQAMRETGRRGTLRRK